MGRIRVLPDRIINMIAAGEVVERPASVVKELVENSIDAGASAIEIRLEEGGRKRVEVLDDGCGMDADDAVAALERHATSKIAEKFSLDAIATLGFRGEALPSIAAVSRFTLTAGEGTGSGTRVEVEGGRIVSVTSVPHPRGTSVAVRDLFFNTPARRRFLRAPATELGHIVEIFTSLAIARPDLRLRLDHGARRLFDLEEAPGCFARLAQVEGADRARRSVHVALDREGLIITGFILDPAETGVARGRRKFIVNGRVVRDRILSRAVSSALEEGLPLGSAATSILILDVPADRIDVNVHPAKAEVRFAEPARVHDFVRDAIRAAVGSARAIRSAPGDAESFRGAHGAGGTSGALTPVQRTIAEAAASYLARRGGPREAGGPFPVSEGESAERSGEPEAGITVPRGTPHILGHYRSGYIVAEDDEGLILIDQHAAHERVLFEEMSETEKGTRPATQVLLFSRTVLLPAALRGRVEEIVEDLAALGFEAEPFGEDTLVVRGVPAALGESDPESLILELVSARQEEGRLPSTVEGRRRRMLATAACHAAVKVPDHLTREKMEHILARLLECRSPLCCPHGRPTILKWDHRAIERRFGRP